MTVQAVLMFGCFTLSHGHDLADNALTNTERLFTFGDVQVMTDGMGRAAHYD